MDELRPIDSLVRLSTSRYTISQESQAGNVAPLLATPVVFDLEKVTANAGANFCTQSTDIVREVIAVFP